MRRNLLLATLALVLAAAAVVVGLVADTQNDQKSKVRITNDTELLAHPRPRHESNQVVGRLARDQAVRVRRIRYGKDFMAVKVRTESGTEGWLIFGESAFEILPNAVPHNSPLQPTATASSSR